jgi:hypothetical protein
MVGYTTRLKATAPTRVRFAEVGIDFRSPYRLRMDASAPR